jgi:hypothetical protein
MADIWDRVESIEVRTKYKPITVSDKPFEKQEKPPGHQLHRLERPEYYTKYGLKDQKCTALNPPAIKFYKQFVAKFGLNNLTPFAAIKKQFPQYNHFHLIAYLPPLWVNGYVDKYVRGELNLKHANDRARGKYYGVHYVALQEVK